MNEEEAKKRLDIIINKSRTKYYKPIQIAEVLYHSRVFGEIDVARLEDYRTKSKKWRDEISEKLLHQISTSSSRFQDDLWNQNAMPPEILAVLDRINKSKSGIVEYYIYHQLLARQNTIISIVETVTKAIQSPDKFYLNELLGLFRNESGLRRSIDKCYEIVTYSLLETIVTALETKVTVKVSSKKRELLNEFADLAKVLLNVSTDNLEWTEVAHIYRVGVTNAADRGLDMWASFGIAIQVKHLTLDASLAEEIVDRIESDRIVIVCLDVDSSIIKTVIKQIGWGKRVRGIIKESELLQWYDLGCRGQYASALAPSLLNNLSQSFAKEFPEAMQQGFPIRELCRERNYDKIITDTIWIL